MEKFERKQNITISADAVKRVIESGDGVCALVLLQAACDGSFSVSSAASALHMSRQEISSAADRLRIMGIPVAERREDRSLPAYDPASIAASAVTETEFSDVVGEAQRLLGKILSANDLNVLHGIYDHIGLPGDVIILLIHHCIDTYRYDNGAGRMPTIRYIEKEAWYWEEHGILNAAAADEHISREQLRRTGLQQVKAVMQIKDRGFTNTERNYVSAWLEKGFSPETIAIAYDRTVTRTGKMTWKYADRIISSWFSQGIFTPEDIQSRDPDDRSAFRSGVDSSASQDNSQQYGSIEMTRKLYERLKGEKTNGS